MNAKYFEHIYQFLNIERIFKPKLEQRVGLLWFRRFFRPNQLMSYVHMTSSDEYDINIWHWPICTIFMFKEASGPRQLHLWIRFWLKGSFKIEKCVWDILPL
jgi:hypothetical protein